MRRDEIRNDVLVLLMKGLMYHSLLCVLYNFTFEKSLGMDLRLLVLYVPLFLFAVIRRKSRKFFAFILLHVITGGILLLVFRGLEERIVIGGCIAFMAAASIYERLRDKDMEEECPSIASSVLFLFSYMAAAQSGRMYVSYICYYEAFLFLILFMAYKNLASVTLFLKSNDRMENLPVDQIKGINQMLLGIFTLFLAAGMLLIPFLPVSSLFHGAGRVLVMLVRGILMILIWIFKRKAPQMDFFGEGARESTPMMETGETSMLAQILERVVMTAVCMLLAAGAVYLLARGFYELYQRFYEQNHNDSDESEFLWKNPIVKIRTERKKQKKEFFTGKSVNQRIRHLYKKSIQRRFGTKTNIPPAMTLTELEDMIALKNAQDTENEGKMEASEKTDIWEITGAAGMKDAEKIEEVEKKKVIEKKEIAVEKEKTDGNIWDDWQMQQRIMLYHKARYSQYECGKQELEAIRQNLKMNRK